MGNQPQRERGNPRKGYDLGDRQLGDGGRMDHAPADRPSDAGSTDEWPVRNAVLGDPHAPADRPSDAASTDASSPATPTDTPPTIATWPLLEKPAPARRPRAAGSVGGAPAPDAVVVAQAVGRSEAVGKNLSDAVGTALGWGMPMGLFGLGVLLGVIEAEDAFWPAAALVVAIVATITVVVFVARSVSGPETTRVEVHPHEIVTEAVCWWRRSPTRVAIGFDEITSVDLDNEDWAAGSWSWSGFTRSSGPQLCQKLLKVQTAGQTLSGIPAGPGRAAALAIGQRLVAHGRAHTIQNDATRIHLGLDGSSWPTY